MDIKAIHERAVRAGENYKLAEYEILNSLIEVDESKTYFHYKCESLSAYAKEFMQLTDATAANFIAVARKTKLIPQLKDAIEEGLSIATARKITPVLTKQNATTWIEKAKTLPKQNLEKQVATANPKAASPDSIKHISEKELKLAAVLSEETANLLKRAQEILSSDIDQTLNAALKFYIDRNDPLKKKPRNAQAPVPDRRPVPRALVNQVLQRDQAQCTYQNQNKRCENKKYLHLHHLKPYAQGGRHEARNLTTLCSAHHRLLHFRDIWTEPAH